jgi:hypothetical protein
MGRPRKKAKDLTTEQAIKRLFPRRAVTRLKKAAADAEKPSNPPTSKPNHD